MKAKKRGSSDSQSKVPPLNHNLNKANLQKIMIQIQD